MAPSNHLYRRLDTVGDGSGDKSGAIDGSVIPVMFKIQPVPNQAIDINRLVVNIKDDGPMDAGRYGNNLVLPNGLTVCAYERGTDRIIVDMMDGVPVKTNNDWRLASSDMSISAFGIGTDSLTIQWDLTNPLTLTNDEYFGIAVRDNLFPLTDQTFFVEGQYLKGAPSA